MFFAFKNKIVDFRIKTFYTAIVLLLGDCKLKKLLLIITFISTTVLGLGLLEVKTSYLSSKYLHDIAKQATYKLVDHPVPTAVYPTHGPLNERYGYTKIPDWLSKLDSNYEVVAQTVLSKKHKKLVRSHINPIYDPKSGATFSILDQNQQVVYEKTPLMFDSLDDVPPILIQTLTFIENQELLNTNFRYANPVIEIDRLAYATYLYGKNILTKNTAKTAGGSTLATQMEKYNFSENGMTHGGYDKIIQIISASLRTYKDSRDTTTQRSKILLDYLNSVPLGAAKYYGEVRGFPEALSIFYNVDLDSELKTLESTNSNQPYTREQLEALNRMLQLILTIRNPNYLDKPEYIQELKLTYIQLLVNEHILHSSALSLINNYEPKQDHKLEERDFISQKAQDHVRSRTAQLLKLTYPEMDKLDLTVESTINLNLQQKITDFFVNLKDESFIQEHNFRQDKLLDHTDKDQVTYSIVLYELENGSAKLRATYDNIDKPFEFNSGGKVELGSTAKLRVIISYLESFVQAYQEKKQGKLEATDPISQFVRSSHANSLDELLGDALDRKFSANPNQVFFTGGGAHKFHNFKKEDNSQIVPLRDALKRSINLPFVRTLKEVVEFKMRRSEDYQRLLQSDEEVRQKLLERFVQQESAVFLRKFYKALQTKTNISEFVVNELTRNHVAATAVLIYLEDIKDPQVLLSRLSSLGYALNPKQQKRVVNILQSYNKDIYDLNDLGYLARLHPILLYAAKTMQNNPNISFKQLFDQSYDARMLSYKWLLDTKRPHKQDIRIYSILEAQVFESILKDWNKLGYDFDFIVPSLATALGSSGDKPIFLARLVGIVLNNGRSIDEHRVSKLHFAEGTPFETIVQRKPQPSKQLITQEVTKHVRILLDSVVESGTAIRAKNSFKNLKVGGKTGTGDNRLETVDSAGNVLNSTALSRTATFVFHIGDHWFGSISVYVDEDQASNSTFTSSLAVSIFNLLAQEISPIIESSELKGQTNVK